jgi:hypothetical protein
MLIGGGLYLVALAVAVWAPRLRRAQTAPLAEARHAL